MTVVADERRVSAVVGGERVWLSTHALVRYRDRVRSTLTTEQVAAELGRVLPCAVLSASAPEWAPDVEAQAMGWVLLGDDIAFPVVQRCATTCIVRGGPSDKAIEKRQERRRNRKSKTDSWSGRPTSHLARKERRYQERRDAKRGIDA